jgi:tetratricopeptide (TPR) repeat protein
MMTEAESKLFDEAYARYAAGNRKEALQKLRELALSLREPADRGGLLYYEVLWLLELCELSEARSQLKALQEVVVSIADTPADVSDIDPLVSLNVMTRFAEARVLMDEGDKAGALGALASLTTKYPKQLSSLPDLYGEVQLLQGILLGDADRWSDARTFLENASPPEGLSGILLYYLGHCYYALGEYSAAKAKLTAALQQGLSSRWVPRTHYILGLTEYHLSNTKKAKREFELCVETADPEYLGTTKVWKWLEATSREMGLNKEAEEYRRRMEPPAGNLLM